MAVKVLLVDDSEEILGALNVIFALEPAFEVAASVQTIQEAWEALEREPVDVVSLDIELGVKSGFDLCQKIRSTYKDIFIVMCSLHGGNEVIQEAWDRGANYFIAKPMSSSDLQMLLLAVRQFQKRNVNVDQMVQRLQRL